MKYSQKKASGKIRSILEEMAKAKKEDRIAVPLFELEEIERSIIGKDLESGIRLGLIHYMKKNLQSDIFLPKSVLTFLRGI